MLYELFIIGLWVASQMVVASMVLGGLLCVWSASKGSERTRFDKQLPASTKPLMI